MIVISQVQSSWLNYSLSEATTAIFYSEKISRDLPVCWGYKWNKSPVGIQSNPGKFLINYFHVKVVVTLSYFQWVLQSWILTAIFSDDKAIMFFLVKHFKLQFLAILFSTLVLKPLMKEYCSLNIQATRCMIQQPLDLPYDGVNRLRENYISGNSVIIHYIVYTVLWSIWNFSTWLICLLWLKMLLPVL